MENKRFLECCCTDAAEAVEAMRGGAGRVELCEDLPCGGVTPSRADIEAALKAVNIPVNVLIRVRGGDFVYDETEIEAMIGSVRMCRELGVNGVVVGALRPDTLNSEDGRVEPTTFWGRITMNCPEKCPNISLSQIGTKTRSCQSSRRS